MEQMAKKAINGVDPPVKYARLEEITRAIFDLYGLPQASRMPMLRQVKHPPNPPPPTLLPIDVVSVPASRVIVSVCRQRHYFLYFRLLTSFHVPPLPPSLPPYFLQEGLGEHRGLLPFLRRVNKRGQMLGKIQQVHSLEKMV